MDVKADDIPAMCAAAKDFPDAVWLACASRRRNGRMHTHQTKVSVGARREFGYRIIERVGPLVPRLVVRGSFDVFHDLLWDLRPAGIGPLTVYDVATRVGAYLGLAPTQIYLHTGARLGWQALWGWEVRDPNHVVRVPSAHWPVPLRQLTADQAEDFLCTYRDALTRIKRNPSGAPI